MGADVHPLRHPLQASQSVFPVRGSSRCYPTARMTAHTAGQEMLHPVYILSLASARVVLGAVSLFRSMGYQTIDDTTAIGTPVTGSRSRTHHSLGG